MDFAEILEQHCAERALVASPEMLRADARPDAPDNVVSLDAARTRKATRDWWRSQGYKL
jgi:hypothetical protein